MGNWSGAPVPNAAGDAFPTTPTAASAAAVHASRMAPSAPAGFVFSGAAGRSNAAIFAADESPDVAPRSPAAVAQQDATAVEVQSPTLRAAVAAVATWAAESNNLNDNDNDNNDDNKNDPNSGDSDGSEASPDDDGPDHDDDHDEEGVEDLDEEDVNKQNAPGEYVSMEHTEHSVAAEAETEDVADDEDAGDGDEGEDTGSDADEDGSAEDVDENEEAAAAMEAVIGQQNDKATAGESAADVAKPLLDAAADAAEAMDQVSTAPFI